jgi:hypothetical protein
MVTVSARFGAPLGARRLRTKHRKRPSGRHECPANQAQNRVQEAPTWPPLGGQRATGFRMAAQARRPVELPPPPRRWHNWYMFRECSNGTQREITIVEVDGFQVPELVVYPIISCYQNVSIRTETNLRCRKGRSKTIGSACEIRSGLAQNRVQEAPTWPPLGGQRATGFRGRGRGRAPPAAPSEGHLGGPEHQGGPLRRGPGRPSGVGGHWACLSVGLVWAASCPLVSAAPRGLPVGVGGHLQACHSVVTCVGVSGHGPAILL